MAYQRHVRRPRIFSPGLPLSSRSDVATSSPLLPFLLLPLLPFLLLPSPPHIRGPASAGGGATRDAAARVAGGRQGSARRPWHAAGSPPFFIYL
uniref:Uncharacterized protein n=1 Tax=Oryza sativa subsp. japonica TaxID=39947 RepID=Q6K2D1_ORYSJ|nr:hypothetical protein [Oryza sativa Japonica Group]BAD23685.1 hypothetical protein [Oryza sativa Japonica Group]